MLARSPAAGARLKCPTRLDDRVILHFDYDCFYAACFEVERPELRSLPLAIQQKQIIVTCNYEARKRGLYKLQLITEARKACPEVIIILGEDLTRFRDYSKALYAFLRQRIWSGRAERLGFDEVWLDVTDMVNFNIGLLNANQLQQSWFCLDRADPTQGFAFDATITAGNTWPSNETAHAEEGEIAALSVPPAVENNLGLRLQIGSHLALHLCKGLENETGFTATVGVSTNKMLSKLVGNVNKPSGQTTLIPPYATITTDNARPESSKIPVSSGGLSHLPDSDAGWTSNVTSFLAGHEIGQIPNIGHKAAALLRQLVKGYEVGYQDGLVTHRSKEAVTVHELLHSPLPPGGRTLDAQILESALSTRPGMPKDLGAKIWALLHGVDDTDVGQARDVPRQISIEDTYLHLHNIRDARTRLVQLSVSLLKRLRTDLLADLDDTGDGVDDGRETWRRNLEATGSHTGNSPVAFQAGEALRNDAAPSISGLRSGGEATNLFRGQIGAVQVFPGHGSDLDHVGRQHDLSDNAIQHNAGTHTPPRLSTHLHQGILSENKPYGQPHEAWVQKDSEAERGLVSPTARPFPLKPASPAPLQSAPAPQQDIVPSFHARVDEATQKEQTTSPRRWLAHPRTIRLSTRERRPQRSFARTSRSGPMPSFVFSLHDPVEQLAARLADETLLPMFVKLIPAAAATINNSAAAMSFARGGASGSDAPGHPGWIDVNLLNVAATNIQESAGDGKGKQGRDIGHMFANQQKISRVWGRGAAPEDCRESHVASSRKGGHVGAADATFAAPRRSSVQHSAQAPAAHVSPGKRARPTNVSGQQHAPVEPIARGHHVGMRSMLTGRGPSTHHHAAAALIASASAHELGHARHMSIPLVGSEDLLGAGERGLPIEQACAAAEGTSACSGYEVSGGWESDEHDERTDKNNHEGSNAVNGSGSGGNDDSMYIQSLADPCTVCGARMPTFALDAHARFHMQPD